MPLDSETVQTNCVNGEIFCENIALSLDCKQAMDIWHETLEISHERFCKYQGYISKLIFHEATWTTVVCDLKINWIVC